MAEPDERQVDLPELEELPTDPVIDELNRAALERPPGPQLEPWEA